MPETVTYFVPGTAIAQPRHRDYITRAGKRVRVSAPRKHAVHKFRGLVRALCPHRDWMPIVGPVDLRIRCEFHVRAKADDWRTLRPDADNLAKSVMDALSGLAYADDSQIARLHVEKVNTIHHSGVWITISPLWC